MSQDTSAICNIILEAQLCFMEDRSPKNLVEGIKI